MKTSLSQAGWELQATSTSSPRAPLDSYNPPNLSLGVRSFGPCRQIYFHESHAAPLFPPLFPSCSSSSALARQLFGFLTPPVPANGRKTLVKAPQSPGAGAEAEESSLRGAKPCFTHTCTSGWGCRMGGTLLANPCVQEWCPASYNKGTGIL